MVHYALVLLVACLAALRSEHDGLLVLALRNVSHLILSIAHEELAGAGIAMAVSVLVSVLVFDLESLASIPEHIRTAFFELYLHYSVYSDATELPKLCWADDDL